MNKYIHATLLLLAVANAASFVAAERFNAQLIQPGPTPKYEIALLSPMLKRQPSHFGPVGNPVDVAKAFVRQNIKIKDSDYVIKDSYVTKSTGVTHVYFKQLFQGVEVTNGDISVNVDAGGKVITYGDSFYHSSDASKRNLWAGQSSQRFVEPSKAFVSLAEHIGKPVDPSKITIIPYINPNDKKKQYILQNIPYVLKDVITQQSYIHTADGSLKAAWEFFVDLGDNYFNAHVSADGKEVVSLFDWISDATYNVVKVGDAGPNTSKRVLLTNPENKKASPKGWHDYNNTQTSTTLGNNVEASVRKNETANIPFVQPIAINNTFDYPVNLTSEPDTYREAAVTNLFYMNNVMHDIYYQYGFDEAAGNFQNDNYGRGGKEGDNVLAFDQSAAKINNAHFFTPPDGENPRMTMDIWKRTSPSRDSAFDNDIIAHEYTHGLSNRLTGGPKSSSCLGRYETGGMGEGWGDFFGAWLRMGPTDTHDRVAGVAEYANGKSIRKFPLSTNMTTNPMTYGWVYGPKASEVHVIGTLWSNILYQMYWNLVDKIGFNNDKYSADITKGSTLTAQLIIDGMKLQPCRPTFVSARDAILQGEQQITGGKHQCEIWAAFAKRGVGVKATTDGSTKVIEDFTLPTECKHLEVPRSGEPKTEVPKPEVPKPEEPKPKVSKV